MASTKSLKKNDILFLAEEVMSDIFVIVKGKVLIFVQKGSHIIPISYLGNGEYIGELSFFDEGPRSASVVCTEDTEFIHISKNEMEEHFPKWLKTLGQQLTKKIRDADELIRSKGIRKKNLESLKPLSIEEQTHYFKLVESYKAKKN